MTARADGILNVLLNNTASDGLRDLEGQAESSGKKLGGFKGGVEVLSTSITGLGSAAGGAGSRIGSAVGAISNLTGAVMVGGPLLGGIALLTTGTALLYEAWEQAEADARALSEAVDNQLNIAIKNNVKAMKESVAAAEDWERRVRNFGQTAAEVAAFDAMLEQQRLEQNNVRLKASLQRRRDENQIILDSIAHQRKLQEAGISTADAEIERLEERLDLNADIARAEGLRLRANEKNIVAQDKISTSAVEFQNKTLKAAKKTTKELSRQGQEAAMIARKWARALEEVERQRSEMTAAANEESDAAAADMINLANIERALHAEGNRRRREEHREKERLRKDEERARERAATKAARDAERAAELRQRNEERALEKSIQEWERWGNVVAGAVNTTIDIGLDALERYAAGEELELDKAAASFIRQQGTQVIGIGTTTIAAGVGKLAATSGAVGWEALAAGSGLTGVGVAMGGAGAVWSGRIRALNGSGNSAGGLGGGLSSGSIPSSPTGGFTAGGFNTGPVAAVGAVVNHFHISGSTVVGNPSESANFIARQAHTAEYEQFEGI